MALPDMVGMVVKDINESLKFYRMLGLDIPDVKDGEDFAEVITPNGYRLSWNALKMIKEVEPDWVEPVGYRMGLAFKCENPTEVDALYGKIINAGYQSHREPFDAFWGQRYAQVVDPDGNVVDLFAPM